MNQERYVGRPVESLQHMLRVLSQGDRRLVPVTPDGIFGRNTTAAVTAFQRIHGLPSTGAADLATWEAVVREYEKERVEREPAAPIAVLLNPAQTIKPGERSAHVNLVQAMLRGCREGFGCIPSLEVTGVMDAPTVAAVRKFQSVCGMQPTGNVDRNTWRHLAMIYPMAAGNGCCSRK